MLIGLVLMCFAFTGMYQTFVNKKPVAQIITSQSMSVNTQNMKMEIDSGMILQSLNVGMFALFMMFLVYLGSHIIGVGSNLLKTERICDTLAKLQEQGITPSKEELKKL